MVPGSGGETRRRRVVKMPSLKVYVALLSDFLASIAVCLCSVSFCKHFVCVWKGAHAPLLMSGLCLSPLREINQIFVGAPARAGSFWYGLVLWTL